jgi:hypothetical protein
MIFWRWWKSSTRPSSSNSLRPKLNLEAMEAREVPSTSGAVALVNTSTPVPTVDVVDPNGNVILSSITPFPGYQGTVVASTGDVNHDGTPDLIVAAQFPNAPVKVFDGATGNLLQSFYAFPGFNGTVSLGSADINGDGFADVLVAANGSNGHVKAFSGADGSLLSSFLAFPGYMGSVSVAGADFNHGGHDQIVVGAGAVGVNGRVAIFNPDGSLYNPGFFAFPGFNGPINVATGDVNGDGAPDIIVGAGPGGPGGAVKAFSGVDFSLLTSFLAFNAVGNTTNPQGVLVGAGDADGDGHPDILAVPEVEQQLGPLAFDGSSGANVNTPSTYSAATGPFAGLSNINFNNLDLSSVLNLSGLGDITG